MTINWQDTQEQPRNHSLLSYFDRDMRKINRLSNPFALWKERKRRKRSYGPTVCVLHEVLHIGREQKPWPKVAPFVHRLKCPTPDSESFSGIEICIRKTAKATSLSIPQHSSCLPKKLSSQSPLQSPKRTSPKVAKQKTRSGLLQRRRRKQKHLAARLSLARSKLWEGKLSLSFMAVIDFREDRRTDTKHCLTL